jgi:hypothetical protein
MIKWLGPETPTPFHCELLGEFLPRKPQPVGPPLFIYQLQVA